MPEITELAQKAMEVLTPLLPEIATKASETLAVGAGKSLFSWLSSQLKSKPAEATLDRVIAEHDNPHRLAALKGEIEDLAEKDPTFREQLGKLLEGFSSAKTITSSQTANQTGSGNKIAQNVGDKNAIHIG